MKQSKTILVKSLVWAALVLYFILGNSLGAYSILNKSSFSDYPEKKAKPNDVNLAILGLSATCPTPTLGTITKTATTIVVNWGLVPEAIGGYQIDWRINPDGIVNNASVPAGTSSFTITGLFPNTNYLVRVRSICSASSTSSSATSVVKTSSGSSGSCLAPSIIGTTVTSNSIELSWNAVSGAVNYTVGFRIFGSSSAFTTSTVSTTNTTFTGLATGVNYELQVRANCGGSNVSAFSTTTAIPADACASPTIASIIPVSSSSLAVVWNPVVGSIAGYRLEYRKTGTTIFTSVDVAVSPTNRTITGLDPGASYDIRVRTRCSASSISAPSAIQVGSTICPSTTISSVVPGGTQLTVNWNTISGSILGYRVEYKRSTESTFGSIDFGTVGSGVITGLIPSTAYDVRVLVRCSASALSKPSAISNVSTTASSCAVPTFGPITPSSNSILVNWTAVTGSILGYSLEYKRSSDPIYVVSDLPAGVTSFNITGLNPSTTYDIRISTRCSASSTSVLNSTTSTTTGASGSGCEPPTNVNTTAGLANIFVSWAASSSSNIGYRIEYRTLGSTGAFLRDLIFLLRLLFILLRV